MTSARDITALAFSLSLTLGVGYLGSVFTRSSLGSWYAELAKPAWTPPGWVFGPVWTILYLLMGLAAFLVYKAAPRPGVAAALAAWFIQLSLNLAWSGVFFGLRRPGLAFAEILTLFAAVALTLVLFRGIRPLAAWLLVPYLAWVGFAAALNYRLWRLND
jgi:tryptophan-rich sensory protein